MPPLCLRTWTRATGARTLRAPRSSPFDRSRGCEARRGSRVREYTYACVFGRGGTPPCESTPPRTHNGAVSHSRYPWPHATILCAARDGVQPRRKSEGRTGGTPPLGRVPSNIARRAPPATRCQTPPSAHYSTAPASPARTTRLLEASSPSLAEVERSQAWLQRRWRSIFSLRSLPLGATARAWVRRVRQARLRGHALEARRCALETPSVVRIGHQGERPAAMTWRQLAPP